MIDIFNDKLTPQQRDFEHISMMGLTQKELVEIMTPKELQEMKDYFAKKEKSK